MPVTVQLADLKNRIRQFISLLINQPVKAQYEFQATVKGAVPPVPGQSTQVSIIRTDELFAMVSTAERLGYGVTLKTDGSGRVIMQMHEQLHIPTEWRY